MPSKRDEELKRGIRLADLWNRSYPVGTEVIRTDDNGEEHRTRTRSEAWVLGSGIVVVKTDDTVGGYALDRIKAVSDA